jgi:oligopeptide/dipeptide ABC transporter ATP-binding protein
MSGSRDNLILQATGLRTYFPVRGGPLSRVRGHVRAVDGVDLSIRRGRTLGLVGESGSGKTTVGRTLLRLVPATAGKVVFDGRDLFSLPPGRMRALRRRMQIIFQDPFGSLNPRMTVGSMLREVLQVHGIARRGAAEQQTSELLDAVGLHADDASKYPHEFSGGQRQRIGIARALAVQPEFVVADEPVSALDVSVQAQVLNLLVDLQRRFRLTYLFITHDLSVVRQIADRVAVMYLGRVVELRDCEALFQGPLHPYTQALLSAVPDPEGGTGRQRIALSGEVASPANPPPGCPFHPRCPHPGKDETCSSLVPPLRAITGGAQAACHKI